MQKIRLCSHMKRIDRSCFGVVIIGKFPLCRNVDRTVVKRACNLMPPLIRVAISNNTSGSEFLAILEFRSPGRYLDHRLADLRRLHCRSDGRKEPVQNVLPEMRFFFGRSDIVGSVRDHTNIRSIGKPEQRFFCTHLFPRPHCA